MDTSVVFESPGRRAHRHHGAEFKAQVVRACRQPGVSIRAAVALANGLNANMLRRWVVEAERVGPSAASGHRALSVSAAVRASGLPGFVAVQMPIPPTPLAASVEPDIHIELTRGPTTIIMGWPATLAGTCASYLREMLK